MNKTRQLPTKCGFTLIEMIIVITIIAALAALSVPTYDRIMHRSRASHCLGHLRSIGAALHLYLADNNNELPTLVMARESKDDDQPAIDTTLDQYTGDKEAFHCKGDAKKLFEKTGSSYIWNSLVNGQNVASMDFMGIVKKGTHIPIVSDKENFHKYRDVEVNILYVDGHASKDIQFVTGEGR